MSLDQTSLNGSVLHIYSQVLDKFTYRLIWANHRLTVENRKRRHVDRKDDVWRTLRACRKKNMLQASRKEETCFTCYLTNGRVSEDAISGFAICNADYLYCHGFSATETRQSAYAVIRWASKSVYDTVLRISGE